MYHTTKIILIALLLGFATIAKAQPVGYYNGTEGKIGDELKTALNEIVSHHVDFSYGFSKYIINYSDADPDNPNNVILFYLQDSRDADNYGTGGDFINREHVWAKSHGNFTDKMPMYSDTHNLRPADASVNEDRGNKDFDNIQPNGNQNPEALYCYYTDSTWEPGPLTKGQVARILFYMATRYEGNDGEIDLSLVRHNHTYPDPLHGNLNALLQWNKEYPPSDFERRRNERLYRIQQNRNPFVDHPEFADFIWDNKTPDDINFSNFSMNPAYPIPGEQVSIAVDISGSKTVNQVSLNWGSTYNSKDNQTSMQASGTSYSASIQPSGFQPGDLLYLTVKAQTADSTYSWRTSYRYPENIAAATITSIPDVQGTTDVSPMNGQEVTIAGRVTANYDYSFYLQTSDKTYSGINVYNSLFRGKPGDSLVVRGTISEYNNLTEIGDVTYTYNFHDQKEVTPVTITTADFSEAYEGMLVTVKGVSFEKAGQTIPVANTSFNFADKDGIGVIYITSSSRLVRKSLPTGYVDVTGVLSQYQNTYQLLPRDENDFKLLTDAPAIEQAKISIYPNPVQNTLSISTQKSVQQVMIYNLMGQEVYHANPKSNQISLSKLYPGFYLVRVVMENGDSFQKKILKINP